MIIIFYIGFERVQKEFDEQCYIKPEWIPDWYESDSVLYFSYDSPGNKIESVTIALPRQEVYHERGKHRDCMRDEGFITFKAKTQGLVRHLKNMTNY
jgi:hypothetical protein